MKDTVEVSVRIAARPETVFRYFTDPERMVRWQGVRAQLDPRPGGDFLVDITGRDVAVGRYVEVVPDERVVFTWGWEGNSGVPPGSTTVEVTLRPEGDDTVVTLVHSDLPGADAAESHEAGWRHYLDRLRVAATGGDPGDDPWVTDAVG
jgi:uncharacterized protein YndB with AHSA1/START domain